MHWIRITALAVVLGLSFTAATAHAETTHPVKKTAKRGSKKRARAAEPSVDVAADDQEGSPEPDPTLEPDADADPAPAPAKRVAFRGELPAAAGGQALDTTEGRGVDWHIAAGPRWKEAAHKRVSIAPLAGYGSGQLRIGLGVRAGYTFTNETTGGGPYVGAAFVYHLGISEEATLFGQTLKISYSALYPAVEAGYDFRIRDLVVRPYAGVGVLVGMATIGVMGESESKSDSALALYPGLAVTYDVEDTPAFVGIDGRALLIPEGFDYAFAGFGTMGVRF